MKSLVLFNNKGGVGKTTLTFNIGHMAARLGVRTVLVDYDPQCNLTAIMLHEDALMERWESSKAPGRTVASCIDWVRRGRGDLYEPELEGVADDLWLLPGDLALSRFEQVLAEGWGQLHGVDNERALYTTTALARLAAAAAAQVDADLVMLDVGSSLGAMSRAVLLACDAVIVPLAPDLFNLQGLENVGPTLRQWGQDWSRVAKRSGELELPRHEAKPLGYIVQQHLARSGRLAGGYRHWAAQIPSAFHQHVLADGGAQDLTTDDDPLCIAHLRHLASLVPLAEAARKPLFDLKRVDGVGGGLIQTVAKARAEFEGLTRELLARMEVDVPPGR
ncbi:MAG: ParA family protein [Myxococcota bacterium]